MMGIRISSLFRRIRYFAVAFAASLAGGLPPVQAAFDPVNDDTDIFLANPDLPANRPNVIIYVDNTANWNTAFTNEKNALVTVVQNLSDSFNVGLYLFPETGNPNDNVDGGYARFGIRQMTTENKAVLAEIVNDFDINNDKGNNNTLSLGMMEVYRYYAGKASIASHGKIKTDTATRATHEARTANLGNYPLDSNTAGVLYNSPIEDGCQSNFIIYISNGGANENASALSDAEDELDSLGYDTSTTIAITPDGQRGNWMDEWAEFMANSDVNDDLDGDQHVYTYTVEVDPVTTGQGDDMTALMKSVALKGKGEYFAVSSGNAGQAIVNALNAIFQEIQAVNSVFASTTLPVSVNVRGTNLNQVYIGVFRPDEVKQPRWYGNLKMYQLGFDDATNTLFLADASANKAENPETGFINPTSPSFWTATSSFWTFRTADQNGPGGSSDLPDGDLVEKGGAAQQQRLEFESSQAGRNVYTCTSGTVDCVAGSSLSATPFDSTNDGITAAGMGLGVSAISTLTGFDTKTITALSDTKSVSALSTAAGNIPVTNLNNGAITKNITALTTTQVLTISALNNSVSQAITSLTHPNTGTGAEKNLVTATISGGHGFTVGSTISVTISGASPTDYNGTHSVTVTNGTQFTYQTSGSTGVSNDVSPATTPGSVTSTSSVVTATANGHPFESGQSVTIGGVTPSDYNGVYASINKLNVNQFTFVTAAPLAPITSVAGATVTGQTKTAKATVSAHGYSVGDQVTVSGVNIDDYEGNVTITAKDTNTFSYVVPNRLANGAGAPTMQVSKGSTTVTATAPGHAFNPGDTVVITGASPDGYNGSHPVVTVSGDDFTFTTGTALTANTGTSVLVSSGTSTNVTANVTGHQFGDAGDVVSVKIEGVTNLPAAYNGTVSATIVDANTFTYDTVDGTSAAPATGTITARLATSTAFATLAAHGYGNAGDTFTITVKGATPTSYNRTDVTATVIDADTFRYPLATVSAQGAATGTLTANQKTTTARVRAAAHGFGVGDSVAIAGASPTAFNGTFTIVTAADADNFTYSLLENNPTTAPQGDATGTMTAASGTGSGELDDLVAWVRGADNFDDEDTDTVTTDIRASVHGDVLHSRPAVVNYNRHGNDNDVYIFYGANDGMFRAVKGGFDQSDLTEPTPGQEAWAFLPEEFFDKLERMRNNEPLISSFNKKPYFADGSIGTFAKDADGDGIIAPATSDADDTVQLFISMRRGGRFIYALDVSTPENPKLLWRKSSSDTGWGELGYSWSLPRVTTIEMDHDGDDSTDPESVNVLVFGAGYDPSPEDVSPETITGFDETQVSTGANYPRSMGRGIFIVEMETGDIIWQAGPPAADPTADPLATQEFLEVADMDYAIPSDVTVITDRNGTIDNRAYVGDTGGQIWRVDFADPDPEDWTVTRLAALSDHGSAPEGLRKFLFPPDVVYHEDGYDAVLIGAGDREHPFDESVENRFYMVKDEGTGTTPVTQDIEEDDLFDATSNCIQDSSACDSGSGQTPETALADLASSDGWYITLADGEKVVGSAVTLNSVTFFNTNQPSSATPTSCTSDLGVARQYKVLFDDATAIADQNIDGSVDALDRAEVHPGGGYLPSPVPVVVEIDGQIHEGVISGVSVDEPPGSLLNARLRKFWYREMD